MPMICRCCRPVGRLAIEAAVSFVVSFWWKHFEGKGFVPLDGFESKERPGHRLRVWLASEQAGWRRTFSHDGRHKTAQYCSDSTFQMGTGDGQKKGGANF